jgi:hypothetical protein
MMQSYRLFPTFLSAAAFIALAGPAAAQDGPNVGEKQEGSRGVLAEVDLAHELYAYGRTAEDPLAVIVAAKIVASVPTQPTERAKEEKPPEGAAAEATQKTNEAGPPKLELMLETARELAGEDEVLLGMIADVEAGKSKGRVPGPLVTIDIVQAGFTNTYYDQVFEGGELAEVATVGDTDTDLDLFIYDEHGNLICSDTDYSDRTYCSWYPRYRGPFAIVIKNLGGVWNEYRLFTN